VRANTQFSRRKRCRDHTAAIEQADFSKPDRGSAGIDKPRMSVAATREVRTGEACSERQRRFRFGGFGSERTCKPGSVPTGRRQAAISLGCRLPGTSSSLPGDPLRDGQPRARRPCGVGQIPCLALLPMGFAEPDRSPGLLVSSYLTVSPLPALGGPRAGGLLSVALSLTLRPVGVTHHRALRSPDFPPAPKGPAAARSAPIQTLRLKP